MIEKILELYPDDGILVLDGFDKAVIGIATDFCEPRLIYSVTKCLQILQDEGMDESDAYEHFTYNISGGYLGPQTPIFSWDDFF